MEDRIPADHPLRAVRNLADEALSHLSGRFEALYSGVGRPTSPSTVQSPSSARCAKTAIDARTLRHAGYTASQRCRKRIEEIFGWIKKPGGLSKAKVREQPKVEAVFTFTVIAYNLIRIPKLIAPAPQ